MKAFLSAVLFFLLSYLGCDSQSSWHKPDAEATSRIILGVSNCQTTLGVNSPLEETEVQLISKLHLAQVYYKNVSSNPDTKEITFDIVGYKESASSEKSFGQVLTEKADLKLIEAIHLKDPGVEEQIDSIIGMDSLSAFFDKNRIYNTGTVYPPAVFGVTSVENYPKVKAAFEKYNADLPFQLVWQKTEAQENYNANNTTPKYEMWLYAYKKNDKKIISNAQVINAKAEPSPYTGMIEIRFDMDNTGAKMFAEMTTQAANNNNREILILINEEVVSAPRVNGAITGGSASISGAFSLVEADRIAGLLRMPNLPCDLIIKEEGLLAK